MKSRTALLLAFTTLAGAGAIVAGANAQQAAPPAPQATEGSGPSGAGAGPMGSPGGPMGGPGMHQRGRSGEGAGSGPRYSAEDRAAFFDARIAAVKAGLRLTPDQEKMWPAVETAVRDMVRQRMEAREKAQAQAAPADPIERIARMGEAATARGATMTKLADAARPLYTSLNEEQKRRLMVLAHPMRGGDGPHRMMGGGRHGGDRRHAEERHEHHGMMRGGGRHGEGRDRGGQGERYSGGYDRHGYGWQQDDSRRGMREDYYRR
ncbi:MAG: Spy/CpxP family protein refolding chaperone [Beijerinckiaceae bacterium]|nr:Spy/CpxP family protein refolding chaperone [Beijerinckiaceae bacterium]